MNLDFFGVFDYSSGDSDTYEYTATEFSEIFKAITTNGIVKGFLDEMAFTLNGLSITVKPGGCFINGRYGKISTNKTLTCDASETARKDRVVLRLDVANRTISLEIVKGTGDSVPALTQTDSIYELPIATVSIPAGSTSATIIDDRIYYYTPTEAIDKLNEVLDGTSLVYACYA